MVLTTKIRVVIGGKPTILKKKNNQALIDV